MSPPRRASIVRDLRALGVGNGDLLMVHASLRAIGAVDGGTIGGAVGVLDALREAIGADGTLLVNVGVRDDWSWVNERPERERADLLRDAEPFDCLLTPADPDVGVLAEVFRTARGTIVSDHPEGRFAASGPLAHVLTDDVPWNDYYAAGSPLERFVEHGGSVLRLGADLDTVTLLHFAEHLAPIESKRRVRRHRRVSTDDGSVIRTVDTLDDSDGIVDHPGEDYFATITREYLATGRARVGRVGGAMSELVDGADLVEFAVRWMADRLTMH